MPNATGVISPADAAALLETAADRIEAGERGRELQAFLDRASAAVLATGHIKESALPLRIAQELETQRDVSGRYASLLRKFRPRPRPAFDASGACAALHALAEELRH